MQQRRGIRDCDDPIAELRLELRSLRRQIESLRGPKVHAGDTPIDFDARVQQFNSLSLAGQPQAMHMPTFWLVNDLWRELCRAREQVDWLTLRNEQLEAEIDVLKP